MPKQKFPRCTLILFRMDDGRELTFRDEQAHGILCEIMRLIRFPDVVEAGLKGIQDALASAENPKGRKNARQRP